MQTNPTISGMKSLVTCLNKLVLDGYTEDFKAAEKGLLALHTEKIYRPDEVNIVNFYRFEGASDPADNSILYVIETTDGIKGTLVDSYGAYSDPQVSLFIGYVEAINKKPVHGEIVNN